MFTLKCLHSPFIHASLLLQVTFPHGFKGFPFIGNGDCLKSVLIGNGDCLKSLLILIPRNINCRRDRRVRVLVLIARNLNCLRLRVREGERSFREGDLWYLLFNTIRDFIFSSFLTSSKQENFFVIFI